MMLEAHTLKTLGSSIKYWLASSNYDCPNFPTKNVIQRRGNVLFSIGIYNNLSSNVLSLKIRVNKEYIYDIKHFVKVKPTLIPHLFV